MALLLGLGTFYPAWIPEKHSLVRIRCIDSEEDSYEVIEVNVSRLDRLRLVWMFVSLVFLKPLEPRVGSGFLLSSCNFQTVTQYRMKADVCWVKQKYNSMYNSSFAGHSFHCWWWWWCLCMLLMPFSLLQLLMALLPSLLLLLVVGRVLLMQTLLLLLLQLLVMLLPLLLVLVLVVHVPLMLLSSSSCCKCGCCCYCDQYCCLELCYEALALGKQ
jgi:hypothetical protein